MKSELSSLILPRLGSGEAIDAVCADIGITRDAFDAWWQVEIAVRTPEANGSQIASVRSDVEIVRDEWGVPHIFAGGDADLFFGFGWAMAQDRLWQLDYLRRKALGRLAEILGAEALDLDVVARTVGLHRIAEAELKRLPAATLHLLEAFAQGINAAIAECQDRLPIEFALLDYAPEAWTPLDSVAIWGEFRWYLTGRLPVIAFPEVARRQLNNQTLYQAFLTPEAGDESILPAGSYPTRAVGRETVGQVIGKAVGDPQEGIGSNNWTVAGSRTPTGSPLLASDPHIAFGALSCWYEAHLSGDDYNAVGMAYIGVPAILMGRNENVAWGVTNNICSQRDLYQEQTDDQHPGSFLYDGQWEPGREVTEVIKVRGSDPVYKTIRSSRNGPLINELLPKSIRDVGPTSLRWLGETFCDELTTLHQANRARSCDEFRQALREWIVPTWNLVFADRGGHIGYQCVGRIPVREQWERGFRPGWDPAHQWQDVIPFAGNPALADPPSGWIRSANNRNAPDDFPYPLSGTWSSGHRAARIRHMLEGQDKFTVDSFRRMHQDVLALRAVEALPPLLRALAESDDERIARATAILEAWDGNMAADQVGASLFDLFFRNWTQRVAAERFASGLAPQMATMIGGLALELLTEDSWGWFVQPEQSQKGRVPSVIAAFGDALQELETRLGPEMAAWQWGKLHTITLRHPLSARGELATLLDRGGEPVGGNGYTVCNTGYDITSTDYGATSGANYRLIADLGGAQQGLWAVDAAGQSGHPGSAHYCDQLGDWLTGQYHFLPLERAHLTEKDRLILRAQA